MATDGIITTLAGNGTSGYSGDGGPATGAKLNWPSDVAVDATGNLYIADWNNMVVRKVAANGAITTVAGNGIQGYSGNGGPATSAEFSGPRGMAVDAAGSLYIADSGNQVIRKVAANGIITTVAGTGTGGYLGDAGPATSAQLSGPCGVALDAAGNLYIADTGNGAIREVVNGIIATVTGNGIQGYRGDGGPASIGQLNQPPGVAVDAAGNLYIADTYNRRIREVANGTITTAAGNETWGIAGDGGPASSSLLGQPAGVAVDAAGSLYIADSWTSQIRKVGANGIIATVAGSGTAGYSGDGDLATSAQLDYPSGVATGRRRQPLHRRPA